MSARTVKASTLNDADYLTHIRLLADGHDPLFPLEGKTWTCTWHLQTWYPDTPPKVLQAKARQLIKRGLLDGCTCGCSGQYEITAKGHAFLADPPPVQPGHPATPDQPTRPTARA